MTPPRRGVRHGRDRFGKRVGRRLGHGRCLQRLKLSPNRVELDSQHFRAGLPDGRSLSASDHNSRQLVNTGFSLTEKGDQRGYVRLSRVIVVTITLLRDARTLVIQAIRLVDHRGRPPIRVPIGDLADNTDAPSRSAIGADLPGMEPPRPDATTNRDDGEPKNAGCLWDRQPTIATISPVTMVTGLMSVICETTRVIVNVGTLVIVLRTVVDHGSQGSATTPPGS